MDLKGSLVDTRLRIYPSKNLITFFKTLPDKEYIPVNILKLICRSSKGKLNEETECSTSVLLNDNDIDNLKRIRKVVKDKGTSETDVDIQDASKEISDEEKEVNNETEKAGDTPEKQLDRGSVGKKDVTDSQGASDKKESQKQDIPFLYTSDIDWLYTYLQKRRSKGDNVPYLHVLLEGANVEMPENRVIKRNPDLEARCVKLRAQQEAREYRKMTKTVDNVRLRFPEDSISYQMKQLNRQLIAIGQFILSIFAGFLFGFRGVEWIVGNLDFGFRLLLGVMCALIIALAEIYFLAKKLNEELNVPETVQLGGPPKFVDESKFMNYVSKKMDGKEHQD